MAYTETAAHKTARESPFGAPAAFVRFHHVKKAGDGADYPFSVDFSTGTILSPTKTKQPWMGRPEGNTQTVEAEQGRSSIGTFPLSFLDLGGKFLPYLSAPRLTLKTAMTAGSPTDGGFVELAEAIAGLPDVGTIEITTGGVIERVRYDQVDLVNKKVRVATSGRGADGTTAASHAIGDLITNGEQIRAGQRGQLWTGYADINEDQFTPWPKMEVGRVEMLTPRSYRVQLQDIQRTLRRKLFLSASATAPYKITGHPLTVGLKWLTSTGLGTNGVYDTELAENGLAVPQTLVDLAGIEQLRDREFPGQTYQFEITESVDGKTVLEQEVLKTLNCYPTILQSGKISIKRYKPGIFRAAGVGMERGVATG